MEEIALYPGVTVWPALSSPLSADTFFIRQGETVWVFDVGNDPRRARALNEIPGEKRVVLSHFHADHMGAMPLIEASEVYAGAFTCKKLKRATPVTAPLSFGDIQLFPLPSSHAKGCVALQYKDLLLLGDGAYAGQKGGRAAYNTGQLGALLQVLRRVSATTCCLSHRTPLMVGKDRVLSFLQGIYDRRDKNSSYLFV